MSALDERDNSIRGLRKLGRQSYLENREAERSEHNRYWVNHGNSISSVSDNSTASGMSFDSTSSGMSDASGMSDTY